MGEARQRVAAAYEKYGARGIVNMARHSADEQALVELAKRAQSTGISATEADTMLQWANEIGMRYRNDIGTSHWIGGDHIHIGPVNHIPVK